MCHIGSTADKTLCRGCSPRTIESAPEPAGQTAGMDGSRVLPESSVGGRDRRYDIDANRGWRKEHAHKAGACKSSA